MRTPFIAANWKMHVAPDGFDASTSPYRPHPRADVVVFPTALDIAACERAEIIVGGQGARPEGHGAFTGDISMELLAARGCRYVLCGHSERRLKHGETDDDVTAQVIAALEAALHPVICVGESAADREKGKSEKVISAQLKAIISILTSSDGIIAYEPVWAISGGNKDVQPAGPEDAQKMHAFIRSLLPKERRDTVRIIYGGSAKPDNAFKLMREPDIDGLLVGGASLDPDHFKKIIEMSLDAKGLGD